MLCDLFFFLIQIRESKVKHAVSVYNCVYMWLGSIDSENMCQRHITVPSTNQVDFVWNNLLTKTMHRVISRLIRSFVRSLGHDECRIQFCIDNLLIGRLPSLTQINYYRFRWRLSLTYWFNWFLLETHFPAVALAMFIVNIPYNFGCHCMKFRIENIHVNISRELHVYLDRK